MFVYFLFLFALAFMDFPREVNRQWMWVQIGGTVFMFVLGGYFDGNVPKGEMIAVGVYTLLWLALSFPIHLERMYFSLPGLLIELIVVLLVEKFPGVR
ncbi:hypothetical protein [Thermococcus celer]|uniref:Uncharacterized protein n=1 Tax=Thermococcus celer Vu 13 = JCM 8558 TaxID=1293037 RepID=A0A218P0F1_THECE|nr:hypothetical protein [Thermococcus celer]ASI98408.1 hypothetical protein A3L02_01925 [Thermococcus celer Vu 13 = JCM 8558]